MYGINLWNSLHVELTNIKTIRSFRQRHKTILMNEYIIATFIATDSDD